MSTNSFSTRSDNTAVESVCDCIYWKTRRISAARGADPYTHLKTDLELIAAPPSSETSRDRGPRKPAGALPACSLRSGRTRLRALRAAFLKPGGTEHPRLRRES